MLVSHGNGVSNPAHQRQIGGVIDDAQRIGGVEPQTFEQPIETRDLVITALFEMLDTQLAARARRLRLPAPPRRRRS
jgi:hypothetical protein